MAINVNEEMNKICEEVFGKKEETTMTTEMINTEVQKIREEVFFKPSEEPTAEELAAMEADLRDEYVREEADQIHELEKEVVADEAAAAAEGVTYEEYVDNKEAGVYDMLAELDAEKENARKNPWKK